MELRFNEPLYHEVLGITRILFSPDKVTRKEPQYNEILVNTNTFQRPKRIIYSDITNKCQNVTKDKCETDKLESNSFSSVTMEQLHS